MSLRVALAGACRASYAVRAETPAATRLVAMTALQTNERLDEVISILQEEIVLGRLPAGARLIEEDLAERYKVKRHVLRDAFTELERIGLIERRRNRGVTVRQLTPDDVHQIYAVREILERAATRSIELPLPAAALRRSRRHNGVTRAVAAATRRGLSRQLRVPRLAVRRLRQPVSGRRDRGLSQEDATWCGRTRSSSPSTSRTRATNTT